MAKKFTLGSFLAHPQVKTNHPNAETKQLTNHDTSGSAMSVADGPACDPGAPSGKPNEPKEKKKSIIESY